MAFFSFMQNTVFSIQIFRWSDYFSFLQHLQQVLWVFRSWLFPDVPLFLCSCNAVSKKFFNSFTNLFKLPSTNLEMLRRICSCDNAPSQVPTQSRLRLSRILKNFATKSELNPFRVLQNYKGNRNKTKAKTFFSISVHSYQKRSFISLAYKRVQTFLLPKIILVNFDIGP